MLAFTAGMAIFFGLSVLLTVMREEGVGARNVMIGLTAVFSALFVLQARNLW